MSQTDTKEAAGEVHTLPLVKAGPLHGPEVHRAGYGDAHAAHGGDHVPHVLPLMNYITTWLVLMVLTVVTVAASYFNYGTWNVVIALVIATTKACTVAAIFMHLRYDRKFHAIIFSFSIIFLGIFIAFTMFDTETRGQTDAIEHDRPVQIQQPFGGGRDEAKMKARYETPRPPGTDQAHPLRK